MILGQRRVPRAHWGGSGQGADVDAASHERRVRGKDDGEGNESGSGTYPRMFSREYIGT